MKLLCVERNPAPYDPTEPRIDTAVLVPSKEEDGKTVPMEYKDKPPFRRMVLQGVYSDQCPNVGDILDLFVPSPDPSPEKV